MARVAKAHRRAQCGTRSRHPRCANPVRAHCRVPWGASTHSQHAAPGGPCAASPEGLIGGGIFAPVVLARRCDIVWDSFLIMNNARMLLLMLACGLWLTADAAAQGANYSLRSPDTRIEMRIRSGE